MPEDTAPTATPNEQPETAQDFSNINELSTEISAEQEQALINQTLGINVPITKEEQPESPETPETPEIPETPNEQPETPASPVPEKPIEEPAKEEQVEIAAPQTDDLWIEVEKIITDDDGNQTVENVKLAYNPDDPSSFIPDDFAFKNDKQLADILEAKAEMAALYKERTSEYEKQVNEMEQSKSVDAQKAEQIAGWEAEIQDLIDSGVIDKPAVEQTDPKFLEDPSVQKIDAVFKFMTAKNEERVKENLAPIRSFGVAFTMYEKDASVKAAAEAEKKANEDAKRKGALVGGSSAASTGSSKPYIAGSASNIWEIPIED